ncbi:MAG: hypothetical protein IK065_02000 [Neisseriaceae bacterium]|nr:hypothetical protein [Neisseriaceae bacterium]
MALPTNKTWVTSLEVLSGIENFAQPVVYNYLYKKIIGNKYSKTVTAQGLAEGDALENILNSMAKMLGVKLEKELKGNPNSNTWHIVSYDEKNNPE